MIDESLQFLYDAIDQQDKRDWTFSDFEKQLEAQGAKIGFPFNTEIVWDQKSLPACTRYALTHISNAENIIEYGSHSKVYTQIDPIIERNRGNKVKSLQSAMNQLKDEGFIQAYLRIDKLGQDGINQIKKALDLGLFIYTGSSNGDWTKIGNSKTYIIQTTKFIGHAWGIVDYEESTRIFKCINSFGKDWGDDGYFYLPYEYIDKIYNKYAVLDKLDTDKFVDSIEKQWAKTIVRDAKKLYENTKRADVKQKIHEMADLLRKDYGFTDADI